MPLQMAGHTREEQAKAHLGDVPKDDWKGMVMAGSDKPRCLFIPYWKAM